MKKLLIPVSVLFLAITVFAQEQAANAPIVIISQGSFLAGGTVEKADGVYDTKSQTNPQGQTMHGDHAYVSYQIPVNASPYPMVFLHGAGQSGKTWETTPDGREGFGTLFLRRGYSTYIVDQPRRGRAGQSIVPASIPATPQDQYWFENFRMGHWPNLYAGSQFPDDSASLDQFFRQITPNTGDYDPEVIANAMSAVFDRIGDGILVTHSQGGGPGWITATKNPHIKAIAAYEPGSDFVFPEGEVPAHIKCNDSYGILEAKLIKAEDFATLTHIPIIIYYGDNIPTTPSSDWAKDHWRVRLEMARMFVTCINRHGGNAKLVVLPDIGIKGNSHFLFAEKNNVELADLLQKWLEKSVPCCNYRLRQ